MAINPVSFSPDALAALKEAAAAKSQAASNTTATQANVPSFDQLLSSLTQSQNQSDDLIQQLAGGGSVDLHQVMIGLEENDINFRVTMAIRDKLVDAYKEVMRMQV
jgi:flagellar hook-basal body complex protein FliE